jgi:hypothetical protein
MSQQIPKRLFSHAAVFFLGLLIGYSLHFAGWLGEKTGTRVNQLSSDHQ